MVTGECTPYYCTFDHPSLEDLERLRNQAAIRVRARRRIRRILGPVYAPSSAADLAPALRAALEIEKLGWRWR